ncbi:MAG: putative cysteine proteinase [Streblomastix strix]|uniref:Putative cysteine proteinase n=1 Tax=Streblomastix strix TaxID=222440 RepID=A0A5J4WV78_9EUKA|nr:MAG: putative cysteine proteinase [Streblomastix strix]
MAMMETHRNQQLISDKIYPRDSGNVGVYNPSGQYRLRLFINGCWRMVEIDDLLPCFPLPVTLESDWNTRVIMSASSTIKGELWVPLLEKGYLRALGNGYDSKSINPFDVFFSFCQWIPQTSWNLKGIFEKDYEWKKLVRRVKSDNILVILGIQQIDMNDQGPQRFNFITTHSYTLIDVAQIGNSKLFRLRDAHRKEQVSRKFNSTTLLQQYEKRNDGSFWIDIEDAKKYFSMGFLSWRPDLFTYKQQINFVWKEQQYMHDTIDELSQFAPQFLLYKRSKEQKIWILLHRHYQSKVSPYSLIESEQKEEDMLISISFCRHNHPEERPVNPKITHRDGNICFSSTYSKSHFNLFQIGLFDEDIHKTDQNELGLNEVQLHLAKMQEFTCNYVGWFTIRAEILKAPEHSKGDLRFSLYIFSDQKVDQPVPIY